MTADPQNHRFGRVGMIARWQPVHLGHAAVLRALCDQADLALIGIGSANEHNLRTPFSFEEVSAMIRLALGERDNFRLIPVPDLHNGPRWQKMVTGLFGGLDRFITDNPYVASLMSSEYALMRPVDLLPVEDQVLVTGTMVRQEMARGDGWKDLAPLNVAMFIMENRLDERFRAEFGLQTLASGLHQS